jgi:hypothetical protein
LRIIGPTLARPVIQINFPLHLQMKPWRVSGDSELGANVYAAGDFLRLELPLSRSVSSVNSCSKCAFSV